jgi:uncharacterized protein DUF397
MTTPLWRKSSRSGAQEGACVEVARLVDGVGVRDSKNPDVGQLTVSVAEFDRLLSRIRAGKLES